MLDHEMAFFLARSERYILQFSSLLYAQNSPI